MYRLLEVLKLATSPFHSEGDGGVERVNHTMTEVLAVVVNEPQNDWDVHLPHVEFAYSNSVSSAPGLAPNDVRIGRLPRGPLGIFDRPHIGGHQRLPRDQLGYCDPSTDYQKRSYILVREQNALPILPYHAAKIRVVRSSSQGFQIRRRKPGVGVQLCCQHLPRSKGGHR